MGVAYQIYPISVTRKELLHKTRKMFDAVFLQEFDDHLHFGMSQAAGYFGVDIKYCQNSSYGVENKIGMLRVAAL